MCFCGLSLARLVSTSIVTSTPSTRRRSMASRLAPLGAIAAPPLPGRRRLSRTPRRDRSSSTFTRNSVVCNHASSRFNSFRASLDVLGEELGAVGRVSRRSAPLSASRRWRDARSASRVDGVVAQRVATVTPSPRRPRVTPTRSTSSHAASRKTRTPLTNREERVALSPLGRRLGRDDVLDHGLPLPSVRPARAPASSSPRRARPATRALTRPPRRTAGPYHRRSPGPTLLDVPGATWISSAASRRRCRRSVCDAREAAPPHILRQYHTT